MPVKDLDRRRASNKLAVHKHYHTKQIRRFESEFIELAHRQPSPEIVARIVYTKAKIAQHIAAIRGGPRHVDRLSEEELDRLLNLAVIDTEESKADKEAELASHEPEQIELYLRDREDIKNQPMDHAIYWHYPRLQERYQWLQKRKPGRTDIPPLPPLADLMGEAHFTEEISESTGEPKERPEFTVEDQIKARETKHQKFSPDEIFSDIRINAKNVFQFDVKHRRK